MPNKIGFTAFFAYVDLIVKNNEAAEHRLTSRLKKTICQNQSPQYSYKEIECNLQLESVKSFNKLKDLLEAVHLHCDLLPEYMPMKWGWYEPLREEFVSSQIEKLQGNGLPLMFTGSVQTRTKRKVIEVSDEKAELTICKIRMQLFS